MDSSKFVDRCLNECGGGNGKFQKVFASLLATLFGIQSLFIYGFGFFEMIPALTCQSMNEDGSINYYDCTKEEACNLATTLTYSINYGSPKTVTNWITQYDLVCTDSYRISLLGSLLFSGLLFGSIFISRLGDVYGRKIVLASVDFVSSICLLGILLLNDLYMLFGLIFVFGLTAAPRYSLAYVYTSEVVSSQHESTYCMLAMIIDSLSMIVFGVYFFNVKSIYPLLWFLLIFQTILQIIALIYIPESPKYLYEKGDMDGFFKALEKIAKFNKAKVNITEMKSLQMNASQSQQQHMYAINENYETESIDKEEDHSKGQEKPQPQSQQQTQIGETQQQSNETNSAAEQLISIEQKGSFKQFYQNRRYLINAIALSISWGVGSYSFYFTEFYMKYVPVENEYLLSIVIGISDVVSASFFKVLIYFASAKRIIGVSYLILSIISLAFALCLFLNLEHTDSTKIVYAFFIFGIRLSSGVGFMLSYYANNQYFPPLLRAGIFAITNIASRMSTILSPIVAEALYNPAITITIAGIIATVSTSFLKDAEKMAHPVKSLKS